jgi:crossover junction endodeoxyribonuclease RuvC
VEQVVQGSGVALLEARRQEMQMRWTVGIDPGLSGAVAFLDGEELVEVVDMPVVRPKGSKPRVDAGELTRVLANWAPVEAVVERVGPAPGAGVSSMFRFGYGAGVIEGVLAGLGVKVVLVVPAVWKPAMRLGSDKDRARAEAQRLFPAHAGQFVRVRDDGRAEAALLGLYGARLALAAKAVSSNDVLRYNGIEEGDAI